MAIVFKQAVELPRTAHRPAPKRKKVLGIHLSAIKNADGLERLKEAGRRTTGIADVARVGNYSVVGTRTMALSKCGGLKNHPSWFKSSRKKGRSPTSTLQRNFVLRATGLETGKKTPSSRRASNALTN